MEGMTASDCVWVGVCVPLFGADLGVCVHEVRGAVCVLACEWV